eukprot:jgi/Ulvmu1/341/UM001_0345.1
MTTQVDSDSAQPENASNFTSNPAAAIASQIEQVANGQPRARKPVEGLEDDETAAAAPTEKEFVSSKASRVAKRKWAAAQQQQGNLPRKPATSNTFGTKAILIITSTIGMLLFGYRMFLTYWQTGNEQFFIYTPEQLAKHGANSRSIWVGIAGEVYDVTKAKKFYGKDGGYNFFTGRDASRAYLTGKFQDDLNDDVEDFTDEQFHGLMHWKNFYLKEYEYKGRLVGAFFDEQGLPTALSRRMWEGNSRHKAVLEERKNKKLAYPTCNSRWSAAKGSEVWCDDGMFPRKLTEMVGGKAEQRCACFKERGMSNLRQVYPGCKPVDTWCRLQPEPAVALPEVEAQADEL